MMDQSSSSPLPSTDQLRKAMEIYLSYAYEGPPPEPAINLIPPEDCDAAEWLMSDVSQRDPADAPLANVRSFALRLGNRYYPHMKLRLSCPAGGGKYLLSVDCHDAFLRCPPGSGEAPAIEDLKRKNAAIASAIHAAWDEAGLPTERNYLREKIMQARARHDDEGPPLPGRR